MTTKRPAYGSTLMQSVKRYRHDLPTVSNREATLTGIRRTSALASRIMRLQGHHGEVFTCKFHPDGEVLLSSGADKQILIWNVFGKCENKMTLTGHKGSIMEAHFSSDGEHIFSCSTDKTIAVWDTFTGARLRQLRGHSSFVNSVNTTIKGVSMLCSGSEDCTVRIWDERKRDPIHKISTRYPITSSCFNGTGDQIIYAGMNNDITVWDIRMREILYKLEGHTSPITGTALSPDGSYLLSNSQDNSLRIWDISSTVHDQRCLKTFKGIQHSFENNLLRCAWSKDCSKIAAGSSDRHVYVWETLSQRILYKLPGPKGSVNDVDFHPKQPIILTATSDQSLYMGEIEN